MTPADRAFLKVIARNLDRLAQAVEGSADGTIRVAPKSNRETLAAMPADMRDAARRLREMAR